MIRILMVFLLALFGVIAQILMKRGVHGMVFSDVRHVPMQVIQLFINPYVASALIIYVVGFAAYLILLSKMQVNVLYPLSIAMSFAILTILSPLFLSESFSVLKIFGMVCIVAGIALITVAA